nr:Ankyrin repeat domain containing protein [Pandoravirus belohorizontensis]
MVRPWRFWPTEIQKNHDPRLESGRKKNGQSTDVIICGRFGAPQSVPFFLLLFHGGTLLVARVCALGLVGRKAKSACARQTAIRRSGCPCPVDRRQQKKETRKDHIDKRKSQHRRARINQTAEHDRPLWVRHMAAAIVNPIMTLGGLPDEMLVAVLCRLPCADLYSTAPRVCRRWRALSKDRTALGPPVCLGGHIPRSFFPPTGEPLPPDWLSYAHDKECPRYRHACRDAVVDDRADVVTILYERDYPLNGVLTSAAAAQGNVPMLVHLLNMRCPWGDDACRLAAAGGHLEAVRFLRARGCRWDASTCSAAARGGHLHVLKYAHEHGCAWDERTPTAAAKGGHLGCLQYARTYGCAWTQQMVTWGAAKHGHLDCLRWAVEHSRRGDQDGCTDVILRDAARRGHLDVVCYLVDRACPLTWGATAAAAEGGHLAVLQYLREAGCPWTSAVCRNAAAGGHLDILAYAHEHGCPWDVDTCRAARAGNHGDCLAYALRHGCASTDALPHRPRRCLFLPTGTFCVALLFLAACLPLTFFAA